MLDEISGKRKVPYGFQNAADALVDLTFIMYYLFARATKSGSICPPAYYADIVCERARRYLGGLFDMATPSGTPAPSVTVEGGQSGRKDGRCVDSSQLEEHTSRTVIHRG